MMQEIMEGGDHYGNQEKGGKEDREEGRQESGKEDREEGRKEDCQEGRKEDHEEGGFEEAQVVSPSFQYEKKNKNPPKRGFCFF